MKFNIDPKFIKKKAHKFNF